MGQSTNLELKTVDKALSLLLEFSSSTPLLGVRELAGRVGLAPSVVQRMVATMQQRGFVQQCPQTRKYRLGVRLWELGVLFREQFQLNDAVQTLLQATANGTGETVYLNMLDAEQAVCVQIAEGPESVKLTIRLGERTPLHLGSRGRAMLAHLPPERRAALLDAVVDGWSPAEAALRRRALEDGLITICRDGYCVSRGERLTDVVGISVPLFDRTDRVFASVTVGGPSARMTEDKVAECVPRILALAREIQSHFHKFG